MKSKRSQACDIPRKVKQVVWERDDGCCILCGSPNAMPNAHYIRRSQGGLGIEENVVTACLCCHGRLDGAECCTLKPIVKEYLMSKYPGWDESKLIYKK